MGGIGEAVGLGEEGAAEECDDCGVVWGEGAAGAGVAQLARSVTRTIAFGSLVVTGLGRA